LGERRKINPLIAKNPGKGGDKGPQSARLNGKKTVKIPF